MNTKIEMMKILFPKTDESKLIDIVTYIENYCGRFGVSSDLRFAHFMAQCREEIGPDFKPVSENLNYKAQVLPKLFRAFKKDKKLAKLYGRTKNQKANQVMIANYAYGHRLGNRGLKSNDGWNYRGAGALQITGRGNFIEVQKRISKYNTRTNINIVEYVEDIHRLAGCILAGLGFWIWKDLYAKADLGISDSAVDAVTAVINKHTHSYAERRKHFQSIKHLI